MSEYMWNVYLIQKSCVWLCLLKYIKLPYHTAELAPDWHFITLEYLGDKTGSNENINTA